ncbi:MAG: hypothetical protein K2Z25_17795 [Beijerinckiaceae bacterium]|nr:hypothetical protein [Beijerinckiaceae bacterium]
MKILTWLVERLPPLSLKHIIVDQREAFQPYVAYPQDGLFAGLPGPGGVKLAFRATRSNRNDRQAG